MAQKNQSQATPAAQSPAPVAQAPAPQTAASQNATAPSSAAQKPATPPAESFYGEIPALPTQKAVEGITFDFCNGLRVKFPENGKSYHVTFIDLDSNNIIFSSDTVPGNYAISAKKYYIRFRLVISHKGENTPIFTHDYDAKGKTVIVQIPGTTLGDTIAWFSYAERFQQKHECKLVCVMQPFLSALFKKQYPNITFITKNEMSKYTPYANYFLGLFFRGDVNNQPVDFRFIGLHRTAGCILGVDLEEIPPRVDLSAPRKIKEKYVVIACQASSQAKYWNNPFGWREVIQFLHQHGYKVVCCDRNAIYGGGITWNQMPWGVDIDDTGDKPLQERIDIIKEAEFFIGLPSGLSWLAWCCKIPIVLISGFSAPNTEFTTPYRVINYQACNSCWNDFRENFDHMDFLWCPRQKGTDRQFECSRMISSTQVIRMIEKIPGFGKK